MKKTYVKPQVYFEDFQLSASIAAGCASDFKDGATQGDANSCAFDDGVNKIFVDGNGACITKPDNGTKYCYQIPLDGNRVFAS